MLIQIPNRTIPTQVRAEAAREHLDQISLGVFSQEEEDDKQKLRGSICSLQLEASRRRRRRQDRRLGQDMIGILTY